MRIGVIGGGPAGLYFALLAKKRDPAREVEVLEQGSPDRTYGFGVVFSERALSFLERDDPETCRSVSVESELWDDLVLVHRDARIAVDGNGFAAIARLTLLRLLRDACAALGVRLHYGRRIDDPRTLDGFDLVVGADGYDSRVRAALAHAFRPTRRLLDNRFAWYGTRQRFETLSLTFRADRHGAFVAHHYRYSPTMSTFIVECDAGTWDRSGLARANADRRRRYCERLFAADLDGHGLIDNRSIWRRFPVIDCDRWHHGNVVLIGDALRTVHFSIGSGTRLAMEDAIALDAAFGEAGDDIERVLATFEATRRPVVDKLLAAAWRSAQWYERFHTIMDLDPYDFVHSYMTRTGRVDDDQLRRAAPRFTAARDAARAGRTG